MTIARGATGEIAGLSVLYVGGGFAETTEGCFQFHSLVVTEGTDREEHGVHTGDTLAVRGRTLVVTGDLDQVVIEAAP